MFLLTMMTMMKLMTPMKTCDIKKTEEIMDIDHDEPIPQTELFSSLNAEDILKSTGKLQIGHYESRTHIQRVK